MSHENRSVCIVTGGARGIGESIVRRFRDEGFAVALLDIDEVRGRALAKEVDAHFIRCDVGQPEDWELAIGEVMSQFGRLDVLVNNAALTYFIPIADYPIGKWHRSFSVNLHAPFYLSQLVLPAMIERKAGTVCNFSSDAGRIGTSCEVVYSACKAGVIALSKSVARETGRYGLRLNVVCPGLVVPPDEESISDESMWTQMRDIFTDEIREKVERNYLFRRMAKASEIANAVVFLSSDAASFITGQTLSVSGGYTMM